MYFVSTSLGGMAKLGGNKGKELIGRRREVRPEKNENDARDNKTIINL